MLQPLSTALQGQASTSQDELVILKASHLTHDDAIRSIANAEMKAMMAINRIRPTTDGLKIMYGKSLRNIHTPDANPSMIDAKIPIPNMKAPLSHSGW